MDERVEILLAEYQAAHTNRNYYGNIRWIMASIFTAASFSLFGISFLNEIKTKVVEVLLLTFVSFVLMIVWLAWYRYVDPFVRLSIERIWKIEEELRKLGFDNPKLHTTIQKKTEFQRGRGRKILNCFVILTYFAWLFRVLILVLTLLS